MEITWIWQSRGGDEEGGVEVDVWTRGEDVDRVRQLTPSHQTAGVEGEVCVEREDLPVVVLLLVLGEEEGGGGEGRERRTGEERLADSRGEDGTEGGQNISSSPHLLSPRLGDGWSHTPGLEVQQEGLRLPGVLVTEHQLDVRLLVRLTQQG